MYLKIKRILDVLLSVIALLLFWWVYIVIAVMIICDDRGPVIFRQRRIGKDKKEFEIYKFRTMKMDTPKDVPTHLLEDPNSHITKVGDFLRKFSLDELPQLINIIRGDMSIVGPRPALYNQYDLIAERDKYGANAVRPGLTGHAQINGRDELSVQGKAMYDGIYVQKMGFLMDLGIILKTGGIVLKRTGFKEGKH
ncbi:MAG: sugar transferase [Firmicutes bacterium]|nr:sugar transferase [Bacillota bacterium]